MCDDEMGDGEAAVFAGDDTGVGAKAAAAVGDAAHRPRPLGAVEVAGQIE